MNTVTATSARRACHCLLPSTRQETMGCGSSSLASGQGELDVLEVLSRFPCTTIPSLKPHSYRPQLVIGRITTLTKRLVSPYSCQQCAIYRTDCYVHKNKNGESGRWEMVYSEVRSVAFCLMDPDDESCRALHIPGKQLTVKYFHADMHDDFQVEEMRGGCCVELTELTPSLAALFGRGGLEECNLNDIRLREWCVEENSQVGIFGIVTPPIGANMCDEDELQMKPLQLKAMGAEVKAQLSKKDEARFAELAAGDRSIIVLEDRKYFQGLKVRPFAGTVPGGNTSSGDGSMDEEGRGIILDDVAPEIITPPPTTPRIKQPQSGETHVRIPEGSTPGSKISVPSSRGSRIITITVPQEFSPGDIHICKE